MSRVQCPCCGCYPYKNYDEAFFQICPICFWQFEEVSHDKSYQAFGGANGMLSLDRARKSYKKHGVAKLKHKELVREPLPEELPENNKNGIKPKVGRAGNTKKWVQKHAGKIVLVYFLLTVIKMFTANIYIVNEAKSLICFKLSPSIENKFYGSDGYGQLIDYHSNDYPWYDGQYWVIFGGSDNMAGMAAAAYDITIGLWWISNAGLICFALYELIGYKVQATISTTKRYFKR